MVTGTLRSGTIGAGDELRVEPGGRAVRVRSVQVHDREVERAEAGQRVALSLPGVERSEIRRGDALVAPGAYPVSYRLDVALDELEPIADGARVLVARRDLARRRARSFAPATAGHSCGSPSRSSPRAAIASSCGQRRRSAAGQVLDPAPPRHRDPERMALVERGDAAATVYAPVPLESLRHLLDGEPAALERAGPWIFDGAWLEELERDLRTRLEAADPLDPGVPPPAAAWAADVVPLLPFELRGAKLYLPGAAASLGARAEDADRLERELDDAGARATKVEDADLARFLHEQGTLVRLGPEHAIGRGGLRRRARCARRRVSGGRRDHARALPGPARHRPARRATPARALRSGRGHAPDRRSPRAAARATTHTVSVISPSGPCLYQAVPATTLRTQ